MSGYMQIDEWFAVNNAAVERKYGAADKLGVLEELLQGKKTRTCRAGGCNNKPGKNRQYCEDCRVARAEQQRRAYFNRKRAKAVSNE